MRADAVHKAPTRRGLLCGVAALAAYAALPPDEASAQLLLTRAGLGRSGGGGLTPVAGISNLNVTTAANSLLAVAQARAGTGYAIVADVGDSTTAGKGAVPGGSYTGAKALNRNSKTVDYLVGQGVNATGKAAIWGSENIGGSPAVIDAYNGNIVRTGTSWDTSGIPALSEHAIAQNTTDFVDTMTFSTAGETVDTFDLYYATNPGIGSYRVSVDGGAEGADISTDAPAGMGHTPTSLGSPGSSHTARIRRSVAAGVYPIGVEFYNSVSRGFRLNGLGWSGSRIVDWSDTSAGWSPGNNYYRLGACMTFINLAINAYEVDPTNPTSQNAGLTTMIGNIRGAGSDCGIILPFWTGGTASQAQQIAYRNQYIAVAMANDCIILDFSYGFADFTALGSLMDDTLHPSASGYAYQANNFAGPLLKSIWLA